MVAERPVYGPEHVASILPPSRRRILLALWAAVTLLLAIRAFAHGMLSSAAVPFRMGAQPCRIDLNHATVGELQALPGIGPERAEAIVLHRVRHGPFPDVDGVGCVAGIGPETVAGLRPHAVAGPVKLRNVR